MFASQGKLPQGYVTSFPVPSLHISVIPIIWVAHRQNLHKKTSILSSSESGYNQGPYI